MNEKYVEEKGLTSNGSYDYKVYIPEGTSPKFIHVYATGAGDYGSDMSFLLNGSQNNDTMYVVLPSYGSGKAVSSGSEYAKYIEDISIKYNIPASNISVAGFSMGSNVATSTYASLAEDGYNAPFYIHMSANSSNVTLDSYKRVAEVYKDSNDAPPFIYFSDNKNNKDENLYWAKKEWPGDIIELYNPTGDHEHEYQYLQNNLVDFINGDSSINSYDIFKYVKVYTLDENGNRIEKAFDSQKEFEEYFSKYRESASSDLTSSDLTDKNLSFPGINIDEVRSDNTVLKGYIDEIRNEMKKTNFFSKSIHEYNSTTAIPNEEVEAISQFFQATKNLLSALEKDTRRILEIGDKIEEMDEKQAELAFLIPEAFQIVASGTDGSEGNKSALDSMTGWDIAGLFARNMAAASLTGAVVGTAVPVIGNLVGAVGGLIVGIITSAIQLYALSKSPEDVLIEGYHTV